MMAREANHKRANIGFEGIFACHEKLTDGLTKADYVATKWYCFLSAMGSLFYRRSMRCSRHRWRAQWHD